MVDICKDMETEKIRPLVWIDIRFEKGSDNIFRDLGLSNPGERLAKAKAASMIYDIIGNRKLTLKEAGHVLGITRTEMSDIMDGRLDTFSMERMFSFLHALDQDIDIIVHPKRQSEAHLSLSYAKG